MEQPDIPNEPVLVTGINPDTGAEYTQEELDNQTHEEKYKERKHPKIALMPPREGLVVRALNGGKAVIDPAEVEKLARLHCTNVEIADWFNIGVKALTYNFARELAKGKLNAKQRLRAAMLENACEKHNATIQIFMAKNFLGMSDSPQPETTEGKDSVEFTVNVLSTNKETQEEPNNPGTVQ